MANQDQDKRPHFVLKQTSTPKEFTAKNNGGGPGKIIPEQNRARHGEALFSQINTIKADLEPASKQAQEDLQLESGLGLQIQFESITNVELAFESLSNDTQKIELLSIHKKNENTTIANVYVPEGKLAHFEKYITEYLEEKKNKNNEPIDHRNLIDTISAIRAAEIEALWTDDLSILPENKDEKFWWEVWLTTKGNREAVESDFRKLAQLMECKVSNARVDFPERSVVLMYGSENQFSQSVHALNCVAELRRAKDTAEFFDGMNREEQNEWMSELLDRTTFTPVGTAGPCICIIDSGVNNGHNLLKPALPDEDLYTVNPDWGVDDECNHGTGLAGLSLYGDLTEALSTTAPVQVNHFLESVKLIRKEGANEGDSKFHASLFFDAVSQPEVPKPHRPRAFSSAVTASDYRDRGRPSSWSAMVDRLASDADNEGRGRRLFILSAGNIKNQEDYQDYPASLSTNLIHDPGQSWNALTVGAYTEKDNIDGEPNVEPLTPSGGLSPFTTTSASWDRAWPIKPDVVFEGGNSARNITDGFCAATPSLSLLTTNFRPTEAYFSTTNATSAASALCANMAAQLMTEYSELTPESIRALIVHSADWTDTMRQQYLPENPNKGDYHNLIRHCGWGVPSIEAAKWSASNSLTLIAEDKIHPYKKLKGKQPTTRDMKLHNLPWPKEELLQLGDTRVKMRVTLSYFIEPNPSARGTTSKFHYPSCRLRFDVRRSTETTDEFLSRINAAALTEEDAQQTKTDDSDWTLGGSNRHKGSLHQDFWEGTAADLAMRGVLAVYPAMGWWRTRGKLERYNLPINYSLIVSIQTPETEVDIYTAVEQQIEVATEVLATVPINTD